MRPGAGSRIEVVAQWQSQLNQHHRQQCRRAAHGQHPVGRSLVGFSRLPFGLPLAAFQGIRPVGSKEHRGDGQHEPGKDPHVHEEECVDEVEGGQRDEDGLAGARPQQQRQGEKVQRQATEDEQVQHHRGIQHGGRSRIVPTCGNHSPHGPTRQPERVEFGQSCKEVNHPDLEAHRPQAPEGRHAPVVLVLARIQRKASIGWQENEPPCQECNEVGVVPIGRSFEQESVGERHEEQQGTDPGLPPDGHHRTPHHHGEEHELHAALRQ